MVDQRKTFEVDEDKAFQRRDWSFERAGWVVIALVVLAAVLGLMGHGPLSGAEATTPDGAMRVEYARFERHGAPSSIILHIARRVASDTTVTFFLSREYLGGVRLERTVPETVQGVAVNQVLFTVPLVAASDTAHVTLTFIPETIGRRWLKCGTGSSQLNVAQFVYP